MRVRANLGWDDGAIVPFLSKVRGDGLSASLGMSSAQAIEQWWQWRAVEATVVWPIDPLTSATSATSYARSIVLTRLLPGIESGEHDLLFPGVDTDVRHPFGIGGTEMAPVFTNPAYHAFRYAAVTEVLGPDDVFNSSELSASLSLFEDGYTSGGGSSVVKMKLRLSLLYDDGTEGTLRVYSKPIPVGDIGFEVEDAGDLAGINFDFIAADSAAGPSGPSAYLFGGAAPVVSIAPVWWFPYRDENGENPVIDELTGVKLRDHRLFPV